MRKVIDIPVWYQKNRIVKLRKEFGFNQQTVADKIGCVLKTYQNYEQNHNYPTLEYATKLAELYNVSIDYLLGKSDCLSIENEKIKEITGLNDTSIETLRTLKNSEYVDILNYIMNDYCVFCNFLSNLSLYFDNNGYDTPVHFDKNLGIFVESDDGTDSPILSTNGERYVSIGKKMDMDWSGNTGYQTISVPVSILASHALYSIQEIIIAWKIDYKKE